MSSMCLNRVRSNYFKLDLALIVSRECCNIGNRCTVVVYIPAEIRGDDAGVEGVSGDAAAAQAPAQLPAEQDVGELGLEAKKQSERLNNI